MIRRKLFAYAVMMAAGIIAGFFIMERSELLSGSILMITIGAAVCIMVRSECGNCSDPERELICLIVVMILGFITFTFRYIEYESESTILKDAEKAEFMTVTGTVTSVRSKEDSYRVEIRNVSFIMKDEDEECETEQLKYRMLASYHDEIVDPADLIGRDVHIYGTVHEASCADNPGCFDYRLYLRSVNTSGTISAQFIDPDPDGESGTDILSRWKRYLISIRERFLDHFEDEEIRGFIKGAIFGDKSDIDEETREEFNINGTGHILAVSGLHIGFLYALLRSIAGKRRSVWLSFLIISMIVIYGEMTLWNASTLRAVIVLSISLMSVYARRPFDLLTSVSAAAMIILIHNPYQLFNTGFQMSFMALLGIAFLSEPLSNIVGEGLGVMIAVQAGVAPLTAFVFHRFNFLSIFINVPIIYLSSILVPTCIVCLFISAIAGTLPSIVIDFVSALASAVLKSNGILAGDGKNSGYITCLSAGVLMLLYCILFILSSEWFRIRVLRKEYPKIITALFCVVIITSVSGSVTFNDFSDDEIVFVSVGQGDCTHIRADGKDILIDGGGRTDYNVGKNILLPYLLCNGAENVEIAIVTHLHTDHYRGIYELNEVYPVGAVGIPEDYSYSIKNMIPQNDTVTDESTPEIPEDIEFLAQGQRIYVTDDVYIDPVWPLRETGRNISIDDPNENNMVYMINYKGTKALITGDLLEEDELKMVEHYRGTDVLDCDILKVGHHGSKTSSSETFLDAVSPDIAVIEVGRDNFYGHPHQQTLDRLEERGIAVYRTDKNGAVGIDLKRDSIMIDTMRDE